jgi:hypothetical protein
MLVRTHQPVFKDTSKTRKIFHQGFEENMSLVDLIAVIFLFYTFNRTLFWLI